MARSLVDLEMTVAEGPCTQSLSDDLMVNESDLTSADASRWMLFSPQAMVLGARAVFGFPVRIGVIRLGVLCLYSDEVRDLSEEQMTDALLMSAVVGRGIIATQAGARPEALSQELLSEATFDFSVHQAAGMLAVQPLISISSALIALRMHAFATSESLQKVSARVIGRELRFDQVSQEWIEGNL
jgi:GAF domain-containing protein